MTPCGRKKKTVDKEQRKVSLAELLIYPLVQYALWYLRANWISPCTLSLIGKHSTDTPPNTLRSSWPAIKIRQEPWWRQWIKTYSSARSPTGLSQDDSIDSRGCLSFSLIGIVIPYKQATNCYKWRVKLERIMQGGRLRKTNWKQEPAPKYRLRCSQWTRRGRW